MVTSIGESDLGVRLCDRKARQTKHTNESEDMPCEIADTVDISGHKRHDLGLARKVVLVVLLLLLVVFTLCRSFEILRRITRGTGCRSHILSDQRFREQDGVQLHSETTLKSRRRD